MKTYNCKIFINFIFINLILMTLIFSGVSVNDSDFLFVYAGGQGSGRKKAGPMAKKGEIPKKSIYSDNDSLKAFKKDGKLCQFRSEAELLKALNDLIRSQWFVALPPDYDKKKLNIFLFPIKNNTDVKDPAPFPNSSFEYNFKDYAIEGVSIIPTDPKGNFLTFPESKEIFWNVPGIQITRPIAADALAFDPDCSITTEDSHIIKYIIIGGGCIVVVAVVVTVAPYISPVLAVIGASSPELATAAAGITAFFLVKKSKEEHLDRDTVFSIESNNNSKGYSCLEDENIIDCILLKDSPQR